MSVSGSPPDRHTVVDTVVVNYFVAVGRFELLAALLGGAVCVPRAVFDPEEPEDLADEATSELRRGLRLHRRRAGDDRIARELRARSQAALPHFEELPDWATRGKLVAIPLTEAELGTFARLRDRDYVSRFSLLAGLGRGEAAALAVALARGHDLATDDNDAITVAKALSPALRVHRIRGLLIQAVGRGIITRSDAQAIHDAMIAAGFWDRGKLD